MNALSQNVSEGARQRMRGEARAEFVRSGARSAVSRAYETGGLRLRFPRSHDECEAVVINTGGGMTGGDRALIEMSVAERALAIVSTQAAEKIYRADGPAVEIGVRLTVAAGAPRSSGRRRRRSCSRARISAAGSKPMSPPTPR